MEGNYILRDLNLSWSFLSSKMLCTIVEVLVDNRVLSSLNISYNTINKTCDEYTIRFLQKLTQFIRQSPSLMHLNLSGMMLAKYIIILIEPIYNSKTLQAVHLSNN